MIEEKILTTKEICDELKISRATLQSYIRLGMPHVKLSTRANRFRYNEVIKWLDEEARKAKIGGNNVGEDSDSDI